MRDTTRPKGLSLYIDLEKALWREDQHLRDAIGRFTTVKGGSNIVTSTGKTGKVEKVTDTHYHVRYADGTKGKVAKGNAIHEDDHKKIAAAKKKGKKVAKAAEKGKTTKATNKANGTGKATHLEETGKKVAKPTPAPKVAEKPVAKAPAKHPLDKVLDNKEGAKPLPKAEKPGKNVAAKPAPAPKAVEPKKAEPPKKGKKAASEEQVVPPRVKVELEHGKPFGDPLASQQNRDLEEWNDMESNTEQTETIDSMWNAPDVQKLMKKAPEKRSEDQIRKLAGDITTKNDKLARYATLQMGKARGLNLLYQVNRIGDGGQNGTAPVVLQETGYYGDLLQAARSSMYETLYRVMKGSQNVKEGTAIGAHVVSRMKQKLHNGIYDLMNEVPAPHEIRGAIADMSRAETDLSNKLGRKPTSEELANHLQETSKHFKEAPIMEAPQYDEKTGNWVAVKKRIEDPVERLSMLKVYTEQQKATSLDTNVGDEGEKEVSLGDNIEDTNATPDEAYEQKERQKELQDAIPKALDAMGLNEKEKMVFMIMFGSPSAKTKKQNMTQDEVADEINSRGGYEGGQQATQTWVNKYYRSALQKLMVARQNNHPALQELAMFKSLFFNMILKAMYEFDLVKSLNDWGIDLEALTTRYSRDAHASNLLALRKSLMPHEYIGSVVITEDGGIHARLVEFALPDDNALYKSFNASADSLKKSMFPHKGKSNHAINNKAADYVKANKAKYSSLSDSQHSAAKAKKGKLTWSEELLLKNPGSAWITWGGKRVLMNVGDGSIIYDSANEAHREEHNQGAQADKIDFHHEKEALEAEGKEDTEENRLSLDHGIQAFKEQMKTMKDDWATKNDKGLIISGHKKDVMDATQHKTTEAYTRLTDEQRAELDASEDKASVLGKHMMDEHGDAVMSAAKEFKETGDKEKFVEAMKSIGEPTKGEKKSTAMVTKANMETLANTIAKMKELDSEDARNAIGNALGKAEISLGRSAANKRMIPEGAFMIGNPVTGKTLVVKVKHGFGEGKDIGKKAGYTSIIAEAFDPEGGSHEDLTSWGGLSRALGMKDNNLQETLAMKSNDTEDKPFMKKITDDEYSKMRGNTKLGLQETMKHKDFKLVGESRDKDGRVTHRTYAMDMPDGTQNTIHVDGKGYIADPVMARLLKQRKPIDNINDLHDVMKNAVGNRAWVTAHFGSDIHIGDALGHHIQLEYDGKGAPRVVGGKYDGYRFMDTNDIPKGAVDPTTGEPIKALFKNGKLVDRKFTTKNAVPMEEGNAVMYTGNDGKYKKGRIHSIQDGVYKITDGKHHVIGMFDKSELKPAMVEGKANSDSGQAVVRVAKTGIHRMDTTEAFKDAPKAQELFKQALQKAKIHDALDSEGNVKENLELNDKEHQALKKLLGRSKAGKEIMKQFRSASTKDLQIHIPDNLRAQIEAEGVTIGANGTAKISVGKFEQLRDILGGVSLDNNAREFLEEHFNRKDRRPMDERMGEITKHFQPGAVDPTSDFGKAYRSQFKEGSFLLDKNTGLYSAQLQGVAHLIERGRGIVGHGINYTLAMTFVS